MLYQINWQAFSADMSPEKFLAEYWQKKPLLIKNAFTNFDHAIEPDELAGLAMEEEIQSRIVGQKSDKTWFVEHGPFEDFAQFGEDYWTLLVQATNHWSLETHALLQPFRFIPNWRIDDVMVSFSTPNGGVGPHLDQYDVFIIQGQGKRRWQVGAPDPQLETVIPHCDLKQVSNFSPIIDAVTEPGDLLYIPPNHPHNGIAIENSVNYSVGFQAPSNKELWSGFADQLIDKNLAEERFGDKNRTVTEQPQVIGKADIDELKAFMLTKMADNELFHQFICQHLTSNHHHLDIEVPEPLFEIEDFDDLLLQIATCSPVLGIKAIYDIENETLYINGEDFKMSAEQQSFALAIACGEPLTENTLKGFDFCLKNKQLLTSLLNKGYWYVE
ncbi:MAG: JmjC domain-containing protein [Thalassotalea sp.]